jgi:NAD-dependent SIR2 family protein deacetylase
MPLAKYVSIPSTILAFFRLKQKSIHINLKSSNDISKMKNVVVLTGAGMSAESGIATFRDADGTWENHRIEEVATPEAWRKNKSLVLDFYNQRRKNYWK